VCGVRPLSRVADRAEEEDNDTATRRARGAWRGGAAEGHDMSPVRPRAARRRADIFLGRMREAKFLGTARRLDSGSYYVRHVFFSRRVHRRSSGVPGNGCAG
jgi:hypothetical protein